MAGPTVPSGATSGAPPDRVGPPEQAARRGQGLEGSPLRAAVPGGERGRSGPTGLHAPTGRGAGTPQPAGTGPPVRTEQAAGTGRLAVTGRLARAVREAAAVRVAVTGGRARTVPATATGESDRSERPAATAEPDRTERPAATGRLRVNRATRDARPGRTERSGGIRNDGRPQRAGGTRQGRPSFPDDGGDRRTASARPWGRPDRRPAPERRTARRRGSSWSPRTSRCWRTRPGVRRTGAAGRSGRTHGVLSGPRAAEPPYPR